MKNLINKMLFVITVLAAGIVQTAFGVNASEYYTRYTHEFLGYLGQNNPLVVPVSKITPNDRFYKGAAGYACADGIYINEDLLASKPFPEAVKLFTCAHEATHFALGHPYQVKRKVLEIEQEADVEAARMLCRNGYRWIVQGHVDNLRNLVNAGRGNHTDGQHPTTQQQHTYLSAVLKTNQVSNPNSVKVNPIKNAPISNQVKPGPTRNPVKVNPIRKPVKAGPVRNPVKPRPVQNAPKRNQINPGARRNGSIGNNNRALQEKRLRNAALRGMQLRGARQGIWKR